MWSIIFLFTVLYAQIQVVLTMNWSTNIRYLLLLLFLLEALQLQRGFGLLNEFLPFGPVSNAVLPVCYFHPLYRLFTSSSHLFLGLPSNLVSTGDHSYTFLPCCYLAYDVRVRTKLIFVLWCSLWCLYYQSFCIRYVRDLYLGEWGKTINNLYLYDSVCRLVRNTGPPKYYTFHCDVGN
jgi:hypothetical protein